MRWICLAIRIDDWLACRHTTLRDAISVTISVTISITISVVSSIAFAVVYETFLWN